MVSFRRWLVFCAILLVERPDGAPAEGQTLEDFKRDKKQLMQEFARNASQRMIDTIDKTRSGESECQCIHHACGDEFNIEPDCLDLSVSKEYHNCDVSDGCTPVKLYFNHSFLRSPPEQKLDLSSEDDSMQAIKNEICLLQSLEQTRILQLASESEKEGEGATKGDFKGWSYVGTLNQMMTTFPGGVRDRFGSDQFGVSCEPFDPTLRPWFAPAMSARKAVVILVDESATEQAKRIFARVLTTLTYSDYVAVLVCNSEDELWSIVACEKDPQKAVLDGKRNVCLERVEDNVDSMKHLLKQGSAASLVPAIDHAFEILRSIKKGVADKMILFMASDTFSPKTTEDVLRAVERQQDPSDMVSILGYSFDTPNSDDGLARQLACENQGVSMNVDASADMATYFSFIAMAAEHAEEDPEYVHFTPSYVDADHLGLVITTSMALYEPFGCDPSSTGQKRRLLGVAGNDKQVQVLEENRLKEAYNKDLKEIDRTLTIRDVKELECQLQILRSKTGTECAKRLDRSESCFRMGDGEYYFMEQQEYMTFDDAEKECRKMEGRLASPNTPEKRAYFASVVPRFGAWIQLGDIDPKAILWSRDFWGNRGQGKGECTKIDPRGRTNNIVRHACTEKLPFVCQFERKPTKCEGSKDFDLLVEGANLDDAKKCEEKNECKPPEIVVVKVPESGLICNWPPYKGDNTSDYSRSEMKDRVCCSPEAFKSTCPKKNLWSKLQWPLIYGSLIFVPVALLVVVSLIFHFAWRRPPPQPIDISTDLLTKETRLGSGFSGVVFRALWEEKPVAMKTFYCPDRQDAKNELEVFRTLPQHPNIIGCHGVQDGNEEGTVTLILQLMHMNLEDFMSDCAQHRGITYRELFQVFYDVASGLDHLHKHNFLHLDLKPRNVLINLDDPHSRPEVRLCDFGLSIECVTNSINLTETRGTPGYIAPEIELKSFDPVVRATRKADIFSLGMIMRTCLVSKSDSSSGLRGSWETLDGIMPLIQACTQWNLSKRPSAREVCATLKGLMKKDWANHDMYDTPSEEEVPNSAETDNATNITPTDVSRSEVLVVSPFTNPPPRGWLETQSPQPDVTLTIADPESIYHDALNEFHAYQ